MTKGDLIAYKIFKRMCGNECFMCKRFKISDWGTFLFHLKSTHGIDKEEIPFIVREVFKK
jgi:hypothetical protein